MLSNLASYLLGYGDAQSRQPESSSNDDNLRLTTVETDDDDWLMVEASEGMRSRRSSTSSLPCLSLEESWFVTPPPCFTSTGPVLVETSPLENLLIEHPSMSVYHRSGGAPPRPVQRTRSLSPAPSPPPVARPRPRVPLQLHQYHNLQVQAYAAQKQQSFKETLSLKNKQLERGNKVREVNRRNKKQRRSDRQKHHSGANNNRKCC